MEFVSQRHFDMPRQYARFDLRCFRLVDGPCEPERALEALLAQPKYQEDYSSLSPAGKGQHGPYEASMLRPADYEAVSWNAMARELETWALEYLEKDDEARREADLARAEALGALTRPQHLFRLRDLAKEYFVADGFDVFAGSFVEHVGMWDNGDVCVLAVMQD